MFELRAQQLDCVAHALAVAMRGGNRHGINAPFHQPADVGDDAVAIQFPKALRVALTAARRRGGKSESRAGRNCAFFSCVMRSTSFIVNKPCR